MLYIYVEIMRQSTLTFWEYSSLISTYNVKTGKSVMDKGLLERGYTQEQIDVLHKRNKNTVKSLNLMLGAGFEDNLHPYFDLYYDMYLAYEKGILPFEGSTSEQPNRIMAVFGLFTALQNEREKAEHDKQQREMKRKKR